MRGSRYGIRGRSMDLAPGFWFRVFMLSALPKKEFHGYELLNMLDNYFLVFLFW